MKIIEFHKLTMKIKQILEFHARIQKQQIIEIIEFHTRIMKNNEIIELHLKIM